MVSACAPAEAPPPKQPVPDGPDAELVHVWKITAHVLANPSNLTDLEAIEMHGRTVAIQPGGYTSPWHGTCDDAGRQRRKRVLSEVTADLDVPADGRTAAVRFGLGDELVEYRLSCNGNPRTPPITLYIAGARAMTCFAGVCYFLER